MITLDQLREALGKHGGNGCSEETGEHMLARVRLVVSLLDQERSRNDPGDFGTNLYRDARLALAWYDVAPLRRPQWEPRMTCEVATFIVSEVEAIYHAAVKRHGPPADGSSRYPRTTA